MRRLFLTLSLLAVSAVSANALSLSDPICDKAVSLEACKAHVAYAASLPKPVDTSPTYMKQIDPRVNGTLNYAGGQNGGGSVGVQ